MKEPWAMPMESTTNEVPSSTVFENNSSLIYSQFSPSATSNENSTFSQQEFPNSTDELFNYDSLPSFLHPKNFLDFLKYAIGNFSIFDSEPQPIWQEEPSDFQDPATTFTPSQIQYVTPNSSVPPQVTIARSIFSFNETGVEKISSNFSRENQEDYFYHFEDLSTVNGSQIWEYGNFTEKLLKIGATNETYNNRTELPDDHTVITITTAVILAFMILTTVVGNVFVIAAILLERNLQSVANYLILSLAVADLLVAALVMPLGAVYEVSKEWTFGPELCDMWTVSDVLCCTASILHLVAIALDRYWAVTNVDYIQQRSPKRVGTMIIIIWVVSALISSAPLLGWKDSEWHLRISSSKVCLVSQDLYYQVFATMTSFYLPLGVILILYWRIYQAARKRIRRKIGANTRNALCRGAVAISETTTFTRVSSANGSPEKSSNGALNDEEKTEEALRIKMAALPLNPLALLGPRPPRKREMEARRERKAAKTLAVITGAFVMCWLPFFIMALLMPLCKSCTFSPYLIATLLWLGYFNSTLNPIIYTIFSPDFRHAFRRILCGKQRLRKRQFDSRVSSFKAAKS